MGELLRTVLDWTRGSGAVYSSASLSSLHFHCTVSAYVYPGMNKLSNSQYITIEKGVSNCWKADGLTLLSMPDKNKKKLLACSHIPIGCDLVRFHQPGKLGYDDWSVTEFFQAKNKTLTFYFLYQFIYICIPWKDRRIHTLPVFLVCDTSLSTRGLIITITSTFLLSFLLQIF